MATSTDGVPHLPVPPSGRAARIASRTHQPPRIEESRADEGDEIVSTSQDSTAMTGKPDAGRRDCADPSTRMTRSLLGYGVVAGPFYVTVGLAQALTRDGFDLSRHDLSLLANGPWGWIQIANLIVTGCMTVAAALGVRRAIGAGRGATWGPRLIGLYGLALIAGGVFVADPMDGFPPGTGDGVAEVSWHGMLHLLAGSVGFFAMVAACFVLASRFARDGRNRWAWYSRASGAVLLAGFAGVATGSTSPIAVLGLWVGVIAGWAWLALLSVHLYRLATRSGNPPIGGASA